MSNAQKFILGFLGICAVAAIVIVSIVTLKTPRPEHQLSVSGDGKVFAAPNIAQIMLGVRTDNRPTAEAATKENVEQMNRVIEALSKAGIEEKDVQTSGYNLYPNYNYTEDKGQELVGWNLEQNLNVKIRNLESIGDVIAAATKAGANQAGGIQFTIDDPEELKAEARVKAIARAKEKARTIAQQTGIRLGKLISVYENDMGAPYPMYAKSSNMAFGIGGGAEMAAPDIQPGQNEIVMNVTLMYEIK